MPQFCAASTGSLQHWQRLVHGFNPRFWWLHLLLINCWTAHQFFNELFFLALQVYDECDVGRQRFVLHSRWLPGTPQAGGDRAEQRAGVGKGERCNNAVCQGFSCVTALQKRQLCTILSDLTSFNRSVKKSHADFRLLWNAPCVSS